MIDVRNLSKSFGKLDVLKNIDLQVNEQEVVVLIGASGSGKSTLLRCLNFLEVAEQGEVTIDSEKIDLTKTNLNKVREKVGMVFQHFNLFPHKTVLENIIEAPIFVRKETKEAASAKATALLKKVGLADKANYYPEQLSGGQKQRVAIARAIVNTPKLILADEPTGALDSKTSKDIMEQFKELNEEGVTIIVVTHESEVAEYANRTIMVRDGRILSPSEGGRGQIE